MILTSVHIIGSPSLLVLMSARPNLVGNSPGPWEDFIRSLNTLKTFFGHYSQSRNGPATVIQAHYSPMHQK